MSTGNETKQGNLEINFFQRVILVESIQNTQQISVLLPKLKTIRVIKINLTFLKIIRQRLAIVKFR